MMRTTLTLDDDVAAELERLQLERKQSFKRIVNEVLREGLQGAGRPRRPHRPFHTHAVDLGHCRLANVDDIAEVLALGESESFR